MTAIARIRTAMLSGYVAIPCSVSGVTTAPSDVPISTKIAHISSVGISIGRPAIAEPATARIEPDSQPAGTPISPSAAPPTAAVARVSDRRPKTTRRGLEDVEDKAGLSRNRSAPALWFIQRDQCRVDALASIIVKRRKQQ